MKHYATKNKTICDIDLFGDAKRLMATVNPLEVDCPACLNMNEGALWELRREEKKRLAIVAQRKRERESHFALKNWFARGVSAQEARKMMKWHTLEDEAGGYVVNQ